MKNYSIKGYIFSGTEMNVAIIFLLHNEYLASAGTKLCSYHRYKAFRGTSSNVKCRYYNILCSSQAKDHLDATLGEDANQNIAIDEHVVEDFIIRMGDHYLMKDNCLVNLHGTLRHIRNS